MFAFSKSNSLTLFLIGRKGTIIIVGSKVAPSLSGVSTKDASAAKDSPTPPATEKEPSELLPASASLMAAKVTPAEKELFKLPPASSYHMTAKDTPAQAEKMLTIPDPELEWYKLGVCCLGR